MKVRLEHTRFLCVAECPSFPTFHGGTKGGSVSRGSRRCWRRMPGRVKNIAWCVLSVHVALGVGCAANGQSGGRSVASAWQRREQGAPTPTSLCTDGPATDLRSSGQTSDLSGPNVAMVNGRPILQSDLIDLLLRTHGVAILEQLIGFDLAVAAAAEKGVSISQADVDREYERTLRRLANPLSSVAPDPFDRAAAEQLLETVLAQRNVSHEEFNMLIRRNAYLRKIAEAEMVFTDSQLHQEYERLYSKRARVRHIQLATLAEVERVKECLASGEDFGDLARRYSANTSSASQQGLLDPFSENDEDVPALLRQVAFSLNAGQVSDALRVGEWYHLIRLEALLPPDTVAFEEVKTELERSLRERLTDSATFGVFEKLFREATIEVQDPWLRAAFDRKYSDRTRGEPERYEPVYPGSDKEGGGVSP